MEKFEENIANRLTARHKKCFQLCGDLRGKDVLDIGSSFGWFEKMALEAGCKTVVGIEPRREDFYLAEKEVPGATFKEGSALNVPCADSSLDLVVMFDVIEHIPKNTEPQAIREAKRVLRPGGGFIISTPLFYWLSNIMDPAWYFGHRHYKVKEMKKLMETGGFKVEKVEKRGGIFELLSIILLYIFKWVFRREVPFKSWFEKKRLSEYLSDKEGFETLYVKVVK